MDERDIKIRRRLAKLQLPVLIATTIMAGFIGFAMPYPAHSWGALHRLGAVGVGAAGGFFGGAFLLLSFHVPFRFWVPLALASVLVDFVPFSFHLHPDPAFTPWLAPICIALGLAALIAGKLIRRRTERAVQTGA